MILNISILIIGLLTATNVNAQNQVGDSCIRSYDGSNGKCTVFSNCPLVLQEYRENRIRPEICSYVGRDPVVCCPRDFNEPQTDIEDTSTEFNEATINQRFPQKTRISVTKCEEYSKLTKKTVPFGPLSLNAPVHQFSISQCDYTAPLIVGGERTKVAEFPHMATIGYNKFDGSPEWICGGSLISDEFVLTAAHCTTSENPEIIRLGEQNLADPDDGAQPEDFGVSNVIVHPEYNKRSTYNDIALIRLDRKARFNKFIRPACLWQTHNINHTTTVATGWGRVDFTGTSSDDLLKVVLNIYDNDVCKSYFEVNSRLRNGVVDTQMCAGFLQGDRNTCQGDSGGPIQVSTPGNECIFNIIGITSFDKYCKGAGIYTRVSSYIDWIESVVWK